jgi:hypothetical protein
VLRSPDNDGDDIMARATMRSAIVILVVSSCARHAPPPTYAPPAKPEPVHAASVRDVDWRNLAYEASDGAQFRLRDGSWEGHVWYEGKGSHTTELWMLDAIGYGDLDGDGREDAVLALTWEYYGYTDDRRALEVEAFSIRDGVVVPIARTHAPAGRVREVRVTDGGVELTRVGGGTHALRFADGRLSSSP